MTMNFHDADKLQCSLYSHSMGPSKPRCLSQWSASGLLFEDMSTTPTKVHAYNLDSKGPAQKPSILIAKIPQEDYITDMCYVKRGTQKVLITSHYYSGALLAYRTKPSSEAWVVKGRIHGMKNKIHACGITTDGNDHLFVCDISNSCIQMFDMDGKYLGVLLREGEQGLGKPQWVGWSSDTKSLNVAHVKNGKWFLSILNMD